MLYRSYKKNSEESSLFLCIIIWLQTFFSIPQIISPPIVLKKREMLQPIAAQNLQDEDEGTGYPNLGRLTPDMAIKALKKQQRMIKNR